MREENSSDNKVKSSKFADQNHVPKGNNSNVKGNSNSSKAKSSWGSHIVKGFTAAERKTKNKVQTTTQGQKLQLAATAGGGNQKNQSVATQSRIKRSLIGDLSCSIYATQVHPHTVNGNAKTLGGSQDLFLEIDHLRSLLQESKDRESKLQAELSEYTRNPKVLDLERELELKKSELDGLVQKVGLLECERDSLTEQLITSSVSEKQDELSAREEHENSRGTEMEIVELRRLNKELQLQKRNLACRISSLESQLANLAKVSESDIVEKIKSEASMLRHANEDLCKQVEGLQMNRLNEVEELVYLRWVNSCLRNELNSSLTVNSNKASTPVSVEKGRQSICFSSFQTDEESNNSATKTLKLIKKLKKWPITDEDIQQLECTDNYVNRNWDDLQNSARRHSISGSKCCTEDLILAKRRQSDGFICSKEAENTDASQKYDLGVINSKVLASMEVEKRTLRIPNPPPRPSCTSLCGRKEEISNHTVPLPPPPPPPPPPQKLMTRSMTGMVQRAPQVVEFYHSLMKRDSRKDSLNAGITESSDVTNVRSSMIGEIENRSSHLIAIKADVETQGEFVNFLIQEVNDAVYQNIEDVVEFVKWLDDELCFLVDERAVLKHFNWPEKKADTLREAAFGYRDIKKLEQEVLNFQDDSRMPCDIALKKMVSLSERMERTVYNLLRTRDSLMRHCKEFQIPTDWMLDMGILSKIKFGSVKLAKMYMKRVATELQSKGTSDKDSSMDYMLLQGVRYAFRIHQFAGGFDAETMHAFEELRDLAVVLNKK